MPKFVKYRRNSKGELTKQVELSIETSNPREAVSLRAQGFHEVTPDKDEASDGSDGDQSGEADSTAGDQPSETSSGGPRRRR